MSAMIEDIEQVVQPTANEVARQKFVSSLRKAVIVDLQQEMENTYKSDVAPQLEAQANGKVSTRAIRKAMEEQPIYKFYSNIRYNAQEMVWESVRPQVERAAPKMIEIARVAAGHSPAGGTLRLNPDLEIPRYVTELDVHLMPGCFHSEHTEDDVAQGAIYMNGVGVFTGGSKLGRLDGGPSATIARYLKHRFPEKKFEKILDMGCTAGAGTLPYANVFPDAEVHGIDVGAPMLRFAHARGEARGKAMHFSQQNAEKTDFPDESFDLITSSFFLHEIPVSSTRKIFKECLRLLRPGGLMLHFELPPSKAVDPYYDFCLDWDTLNNNEPSYAQYRSQDPAKLCVEAGFAPEKCVEKQLYNWGSVPEEEFYAATADDVIVPVIANGVSWYTFGAWK